MELSLPELSRLPADAFYVTVGGRIVQPSSLTPATRFLVHVRVLGGKGGFGSLLRSFRFHKSDNTDMCRDLSGRRLKDVKEEKKLKAWISKQAEREAEKEKLKAAKYEKLKAGPSKHVFQDAAYRKQGEAIMETIEDAVAHGLKAADAAADVEAKTGAQKRKAAADAKAAVITKKLKGDDPWLALDMDDSDLSDESGDEEAATADAVEVEPAGPDTSSASWVFKADPADEPDEKEKAPLASAKAAAEAQKAKLLRMLTAPKAKAPPVQLTSYEKKPDDLPTPPEPIKTVVKKAEYVPRQVDLSSFGAIDLEEAESVDEIVAHHEADHLKAELIRRGLKCGGSAEERAKRLWQVRGLSEDAIPKKLKAVSPK